MYTTILPILPRHKESITLQPSAVKRLTYLGRHTTTKPQGEIPLEKLSTIKLIDLYVAGNESVVDVLLKRYEKDIIRTAEKSRFIDSRNHPDEIAGIGRTLLWEMLEKVKNGEKRFKDDNHFKGCLKRSLTNQAIGQQRKKRTEELHEGATSESTLQKRHIFLSDEEKQRKLALEMLCTPTESGECTLQLLLDKRIGKNPDIHYTEFDLIRDLNPEVYGIGNDGAKHTARSQREISKMLRIHEGNVTRARNKALDKIGKAIDEIIDHNLVTEPTH